MLVAQVIGTKYRVVRCHFIDPMLSVHEMIEIQVKNKWKRLIVDGFFWGGGFHDCSVDLEE